MFERAKRFFGLGRDTTPPSEPSRSPSPPLAQARIGIFGIDLDEVRAYTSRESPSPARSDSYLSPQAVAGLRASFSKVTPGLAAEAIRNSFVESALAAEHPQLAKQRALIEMVQSTIDQGKRIQSRINSPFLATLALAIDRETMDGRAETAGIPYYTEDSKAQNIITMHQWTTIKSMVATFRENLEQVKKTGQSLGMNAQTPLGGASINATLNGGTDLILSDFKEDIFERYNLSLDWPSIETLRKLEAIQVKTAEILEYAQNGVTYLTDRLANLETVKDQVVRSAREHHSL